MQEDRFAAAIALIDAENARDPYTLAIDGRVQPRELANAKMLTGWIERLVDDPSEALLLAARAHHIRRWERPRAESPPGRGGYLRWRSGLYAFHAEAASAVLQRAGYDQETIGRVAVLVAKRAPAGDPEGQALEDGLCLVFLETQLGQVAGRLDREKVINILRRTWKKMSPAAREHALALTLEPQDRSLVEEALHDG